MTQTVSHHMLRRRAREKAKHLQATAYHPSDHYEVVKAVRGPWRWRVVRTNA